MPPKDKVWKLEPHTLGKHLVLREYLNAWLPILGTWSGRILFIDAFAGPGEYTDGEYGSPVIALRALIEHEARNIIRANVTFIFIEERKDRFEHLQELVANYERSLPSNALVEVINSKFDETMTELLNQIEEQNKRLAPCFVMIDPFGISGTPLSVIKRILSNPRTEVYISLMYRDINRFLGSPEFEPHLNQLYGTNQWRKALEIEDSDRRKEFLFTLYKNQLKKAGAKYVLSFDLFNESTHIYTIFFGTQNPLGSDKMKAAIWAIEPSGNFRFEGSNQLRLDVNKPDFNPLRKALQNEFVNKGMIKIDQILNFVRTDKTDYHSGQVRKVLKQMEEDGQIEVDPRSRKKRSTYPDGTKIRFLD